MNVLAIPTSAVPRRKPSRVRSLASFLAVVESVTHDSDSLMGSGLGPFEINGEAYSLPRLLFLGPQGGDTPLRLGVFTGLHGDEPAGAYALVRFARLLRDYSEAARGYCLFLYPLCNPTGFEDNTPHSRRERDLDREFWNNSREPEVQLLQAELTVRSFHGIISLHSADNISGVYGYASGAMLSKHLLEPALAAAEQVLPRERHDLAVTGGTREDTLSKQHTGELSAPPKVRPRPFEIVLKVPKAAPQFLQEQAFLLSLHAILEEYRKLIAYARNL